MKIRKKIKGLVILPDKITNIARYISGINNFCGSKDQNVMSIRCQIDGYPHVLLYADKDIKPNETLYQNYNEGQKGDPSYDTSQFVSEKNDYSNTYKNIKDNKEALYTIINQFYNAEAFTEEYDKKEKLMIPRQIKENK